MSLYSDVSSIVSFTSARTLLEAGVGVALLCAWRARWKWHVRQLEKQRAQLEDTVADRTRQYEEQARQAEEAARLKGQFLANMSHQIRTPMSGILGTLDLALGTKLTGEQREYIRLTKNCAESLLTLLDQILDFSQVDSKNLAIEREEFPLAYCLNSVKATIMARFHRKLALSIQIAPDVPEQLLGDPYRIRQLLLKLLEGAAQAGTSNVTIRVETNERSSFDVKKQQHLISIVFAVSYPTYARPFSDPRQGATSPWNQESVREWCGHLAGKMGGRFWTDSNPNADARACFTAELGILKQDVAHGSPVDVAAHQESTQECRVLSALIAEDSRINQSVMVRLLEKRGFQTLVANNGREVLGLLETTDVDLILMDMQMRDMDGYEATRLIRERELKTKRHIPIIAVTSIARGGDREKCLMAGTDAYIAKPFDSDALYRRIDTLLRNDRDVEAQESGTKAQEERTADVA